VNAHPAGGRAGLLASVLARAEEWLLEPAEPAAEHPAPPGLEPARVQPVVAVTGLARRLGVTTVARALGAELAARGEGACAVSSASTGGGIPLGLPAAARLARALSEAAGARTRPLGRLCLVETGDPARLADAVRGMAPLVLDVPDPEAAAAAASLAAHVVLVATPAHEPPLAELVAASLARVGPEPCVVVNRCGRLDARWSGRALAALPEARMGAQLAQGGREPRGEFGRAVAELADLCEEPRTG
jgi:hypothetical protein